MLRGVTLDPSLKSSPGTGAQNIGKTISTHRKIKPPENPMDQELAAC